MPPDELLPAPRDSDARPDETAGALRQLLRRNAESLGREAIRTGGEVPADAVDRLTRFKRAVEIYEAAHPPRRWPLVAGLAVTLAVVSLLLFLRISEAEIELDLLVSEVAFTTAAQQVLTDRVTLSELGVSGLREVHLPDAPVREENTDDVSNAVQLVATTNGAGSGTVDLAPITLPESSRVRVQGRSTSPGQRLLLSWPGDSVVDLRADVYGPVRVGVAGAPVQQLVFASPKSVALVPASSDVELSLTFPSGDAATRFSEQLTVSDLSFQRVDQFSDAKQTLVRELSTIVSGSLYQESLNGSERRLRPGEALRFSQSVGVIRTIAPRDDGIAVRFHGRVRGMSTGAGNSSRSLMPTWLEWLKARHGLSLLWGTALYLFGLLLGGLRWWRATR